MDTLALLCNLHADGPATLQRLRRAGCESLAALRRLDPGGLAARLDWSERAAERFLREAALLGERVEQDEERPRRPEEPEFELESAQIVELDGASGSAESEAEHEGAHDEDSQADESEEEDDPTGYAPPVERVAAVLGAWRELDRVAPPSDPADFEIPRPPPPRDQELAAVQLEGLTPRLVARLAELEVRTLRELVGARELDLARAIPLGFTRFRRLRFLAGQALERLPLRHASAAALGAPAPTIVEGFASYTPPPSEPFETAGPFA